MNSHDRSSAYGLHAGVFRFVCGNGMILADSVFARISITHIHFESAKVIEASFEIVREMPRIADLLESYKARTLNTVERRAFGEAALLLKYDSLEKAPIGAEKLLAHRRSEDAAPRAVAFPDGGAGRFPAARKRARPPAAAPARRRTQGLAGRGAAPFETSQPHPMSKRGGEGTSPAAEQMVFSYRRTHAERIAAGELCDAGGRAGAAGSRWPLAVNAELWRQVENPPPGSHPKETAADRWQHLLLLAAPAAAQILRDRLRELRINVVLRTAARPERSREHIKTLLLAAGRTPEGGASFALGYPADP